MANGARHCEGSDLGARCKGCRVTRADERDNGRLAGLLDMSCDQMMSVIVPLKVSIKRFHKALRRTLDSKIIIKHAAYCLESSYFGP